MCVTAVEWTFTSRRRQRELYPNLSAWGFGGTPPMEAAIGPRLTDVMGAVLARNGRRVCAMGQEVRSTS